MANSHTVLTSYVYAQFYQFFEDFLAFTYAWSFACFKNATRLSRDFLIPWVMVRALSLTDILNEAPENKKNY